MLLLLALAIPDDSDEPNLPLPPPKFHSHRHHHHLGPSFQLVEAMMGELERLYTLLTQAIQREQVRLQLADEWGEFQSAPSQEI